MFKRMFVVAAVLCTGTQYAWSTTIADVLCYYECGLNVPTHWQTGDRFDDATQALSANGYIVSLGQWTDDAGYGTNDRPVGLLLGFSTSIHNGSGNDLKIVGNAFSGWYEPGYVEVARETSGSGATVDGWQDETFYMIKPGNYDSARHSGVGFRCVYHQTPATARLLD